MKKPNFLSTVAGLAVGAGLAIISMAQAHQAPGLKQEAAVNVAGYRVSGPYTHENLSIFLIHGKDSIRGKTFLTLQEALQREGLVLARRTIAKYREELKIPTSNQRKVLY